jgi:hypothetical protein
MPHSHHHNGNTENVKTWGAFGIKAVAVAIIVGATLEKVATIRRDVDTYSVENNRRFETYIKDASAKFDAHIADSGKKFDALAEQRVELKIAVERVSTFLKDNSDKLEENNRRLNELNSAIINKIK